MAAALSFEKAMEKLEGIVAELEKGNQPLEKSLKLYEEGVKLTAFCEKELSTAKSKVTELTEKQTV